MAQNTIWRVPYSAQQLSDTATNQVPRINSTTKHWECWDIATSDWVDTNIPADGKNPYIGNDHYWYVWDSATNQYVKTDYSVAQDAVQSVNGVFADAGGNVSLAWTDMSGANPVSKGGTGAITGPAGLRELIYPCSALTDSEIASGDYIPFQDVSDNTNAKKISVDDFSKCVGNFIPLGSKIQTGSYIGTGTTGVDNPNSITCDFVPKIVFCSPDQLRFSNYYTYTSNMTYLGCIPVAMLSTSYQRDFGFGHYSDLSSSGSYAYIYAKLSNDGKTVYWYSGPRSGTTPREAHTQNNQNGTTYYWLAIG